MSHREIAPTRRDFFLRAGLGFGSLALASMLEEEARGDAPEIDPARPVAARKGHFGAKAKSVIFLFMEGGPSHIDLFDPKPEIANHAGEPLPGSFGKVFTPMGVGGNTLMPSRRKFARHGDSGLWVSDWYPNVAEVADEIAVVRSCWADGVNHVGSVCQMNTGSILAGRPSLGAWVTYGLGTENQDLPAFVVMTDAAEPVGGPRNWGNAWLPATYQGTPFRSEGPPILHLAPPSVRLRESSARAKLGLIADLDRHHAEARPDDSRLAARIAAYELAYRMQSSAPEAVDLSGRNRPRPRPSTGWTTCDAATSARCASAPAASSSAASGSSSSIAGRAASGTPTATSRGTTPSLCARSDRPVAGLIRDLKRRGLLDSTLVLWGGEFGRTPMNEGSDGRDHNPYGFSMFLAGGGIKGGQAHGTTDEFGLRAVESPVHVHDLHATILHLMGLDHKRLTFPRDGREERLTVNGGKVVQGLLA